MPSKVAEAYIEINAAAGNVGSQLDQVKGQVTSGLQGIVAGGGAAVLGGVGALAGIGAAMGAFANQAIEAEANLARFNFTLDRMADHTGFSSQQILAMVDDFRSLGHASGGEIRAIMGTLLEFQSVSGEAFQQATEAAINFSRAGIDGERAAHALGLALQNPAHGMRALRQIGIMFTADQQAMIHGMMSMGNIAGAQGMIMQEVTRRSAGLAEAMANTVQGQIEVLTRAVKEVGKEIGDFIIPVMRPAVAVAIWLIGTIRSAWEALPDSVKEVIRSVGMFVAAFVAINTVIPVLGMLAGLLAPVGAAISLLLGPWGVLIVGVGVLAAALAALPAWGVWFENARASAMRVVTAIDSVAGAFASAFTGAAPGTGIWDIIKAKALALRDAIGDLVDRVSAWFSANERLLMSWGARVGNVVGAAYDWIVSKVQWALGLASAAWDYFAGAIGSGIDAVSGFISDNWSTFQNWARIVRDIASSTVDLFVSAWRGAVSLVTEALTAIGDWFVSTFGGVGAYLRDILVGMFGDVTVTWAGIRDAITTALEIIDTAMANPQLTARVVWAGVWLAAVTAFDRMQRGFGDAFNFILATAAGTYAALSTGVRGYGAVSVGIAEATGHAFSGVFGTLRRAWAAMMRGDFAEAGDIITDGVVDAIRGARGDLDAVAGAAGREMRDAFDAGFRERRAAAAGEGDAVRAARAEFDRLNAEFARAMDERRRLRALGVAEEELPALPERPRAPEARPRPAPEQIAQIVTVEFKTSSLADMWKQVQENSQTRMEQLTQQAIGVAERGVAEARDRGRVLEEIRDRIGAPGPAVAG